MDEHFRIADSQARIPIGWAMIFLSVGFAIVWRVSSIETTYSGGLAIDQPMIVLFGAICLGLGIRWVSGGVGLWQAAVGVLVMLCILIVSEYTVAWTLGNESLVAQGMEPRPYFQSGSQMLVQTLNLMAGNEYSIAIWIGSLFIVALTTMRENLRTLRNTASEMDS